VLNDDRRSAVFELVGRLRFSGGNTIGLVVYLRRRTHCLPREVNWGMSPHGQLIISLFSTYCNAGDNFSFLDLPKAVDGKGQNQEGDLSI
jgi:hypothetical protein